MKHVKESCPLFQERRVGFVPGNFLMRNIDRGSFVLTVSGGKVTANGVGI
ncbi:hypothetical protein [Bacillus sp. CECT 9360]